MAHGTARWLSGSRGVWESLRLGAEPDLAIVQIQAPPLGQHVLDFLFRCLPSDRRDVRERHALVDVDDDRAIHLSEKILAHRPLTDRIRATTRAARRRGHTVEGLSCYASSDLMAQMADELEIPLLDTAPDLLRWGTKSGARQIFRTVDVPCPPGTYRLIRSATDLAATLTDLAERLGAAAWFVKIDSGFGSGHGNAVVDGRFIDSPFTATTLGHVLRPCSGKITTDEFLALVERNGCVVERRIEATTGTELAWPSALAYLSRTEHDRDVHVEFLGVHDQVIGAHGEYSSCRYPAGEHYRRDVVGLSGRVFAHLARLGVTGHVGVDFVALTKSVAGQDVSLYALEINLRQTGTTHPHRTARACLPGTWRSDGTAVGPLGREVHYKATDDIASSEYVGLPTAELIRALDRTPGVAFDPRTGTGTVPHLWTTLTPHGKIGATFFGTSPASCNEFEARFIRLLRTLAAEYRDQG
ncbi:hypothetical protein BJY24_001866 [Nocardia transvalensis]|uniref:IQCH-like ATP-grasp domain-containing protein n=1 Tax=Nocardia transvalensis TaxID=37333 RepID=A0A7W9PBG6_9NOCA|nr:hypothetical protein [Nocardia transvalensis]MBB5912999.1 hypothetical protein [Nocardia transvalensis]